MRFYPVRIQDQRIGQSCIICSKWSMQGNGYRISLLTSRYLPMERLTTSMQLIRISIRHVPSWQMRQNRNNLLTKASRSLLNNASCHLYWGKWMQIWQQHLPKGDHGRITHRYVGQDVTWDQLSGWLNESNHNSCTQRVLCQRWPMESRRFQGSCSYCRFQQRRQSRQSWIRQILFVHVCKRIPKDCWQ